MKFTFRLKRIARKKIIYSHKLKKITMYQFYYNSGFYINL